MLVLYSHIVYKQNYLKSHKKNQRISFSKVELNMYVFFNFIRELGRNKIFEITVIGGLWFIFRNRIGLKNPNTFAIPKWNNKQQLLRVQCFPFYVQQIGVNETPEYLTQSR